MCTIHGLLFADVALVAHSERELQSLLDHLASTCADFSLALENYALNLHLDSEIAPTLSINDCILDIVPQFTYLGSTISANRSLDAKLGKRIGKAATTMTKLSFHVWENKKLATSTKLAVYRACVLNALLFYGSESWTTYVGQEKRLNTFHMRCLCRILGIHWSNKVTNNEVLERSGLPTLFSLLRQCRLRWLGQDRQMENGRIPK